MEDNKLNSQQACAVLGCKKSWFYALVKNGVLTAYRVGDAKRGMWVWESDCLALIDSVGPKKEKKTRRVSSRIG
jgi:excisionase family DNA binding protein